MLSVSPPYVTLPNLKVISGFSSFNPVWIVLLIIYRPVALSSWSPSDVLAQQHPLVIGSPKNGLTKRPLEFLARRSGRGRFGLACRHELRMLTMNHHYVERL